MPFDGLRVLSLESRRAVEIERLIRHQGGLPFVAPSMREIPLENNPEAFAFAERLFRGDFDMMILLTGVGTRLLGQIIATRWESPSKGGAFADALAKIEVVARGPKPIAVLREWEVPVTIAVPEPNTWREILEAIDARPDVNTKNIAVQEYGRPSPELIDCAPAAPRSRPFRCINGISPQIARRCARPSRGYAQAGLTWRSSPHRCRSFMCLRWLAKWVVRMRREMRSRESWSRRSVRPQAKPWPSAESGPISSRRIRRWVFW